ncbi:MAG: LysM domain-containing protein [Nocardioidaceae bacterium]
MSTRSNVLRAVVMLVACAAGTTGSWRLAGGPLLAMVRPLLADGPSALATLAFPDVLVGGCAAALLGCTGWLVATSSLLALSQVAVLALPGRPVPAACARFAENACPRIARRAVVGVLGLGLGALSAPALADTAVAPPTGDRVAGVLDGLTVPDRATGAASPAPRTLGRAARRSVLVRPGDSLWAIAGRLLPPGADDARVVAAWQALHRTNHDRIGDDPDLIQPGTRLMVPDLAPSHPAATDREEHP